MPSEQRDRILELVGLLVRMAYSEGFRTGFQQKLDSLDIRVTADQRAADYEIKHRDSTDQGLSAILGGD